MRSDATRAGVLITRPEAAGGVTSARIAALGFRPVLAPFLQVTALPGAVPEGIQAVLVTSANALESLPVSGVKLLAVGDATADAARARGFLDVHSAGRDAEALAALASRMADPSAGSLLLACGRGQGHALAGSLRERGFSVVRRVFYRADAVRVFPGEAVAAIESGGLHAATFLSTETARAFARLLPAGLRVGLRSVTAVVIGKPAADALKALPWRDLRLACTPTLDGVLNQL